MARSRRGGVEISVTANTGHAERQIRGLGRTIQQVGYAAGPAGRGLRGFGGIVGGMVSPVGLATTVIGGLGAAAVNLAREFDDARKTIGKATGAMGAELEAHFDAAKNVMRELPDDFAAVAASYGSAATLLAGSTKTAIAEMVRQSHDFAAVAGGDATAIVDAVGRAATAWQLGAPEVASAIDVMTGAAQRFGIDGGRLAKDLQKFGPVFANLDLSLEETTVLFGQFYSAAIDVTKISPAFKMFQTNVAKSGGDVRTELGRVIEAIRGADDRMDALNIAAEAFGSEGAARIVAAVRSGVIPAMNDMKQAVDETRVSTEAAAENNQTWTDEIKESWNELKVEAEPVIDAVKNGLGSAISWVTDGWKDQINTIENVAFAFGDLLGKVNEAERALHIFDQTSSQINFDGMVEAIKYIGDQAGQFGGRILTDETMTRRGDPTNLGRGIFTSGGVGGGNLGWDPTAQSTTVTTPAATFWAGQSSLDQTAADDADAAASFANALGGALTASAEIKSHFEEMAILVEHFGQDAVDQATELGATRQELWDIYQTDVAAARQTELDTILGVRDAATEFAGTVTETMNDMITQEMKRAEILQHINADELAALLEQGATVDQIWGKIEAHSQRMLDATIDAALKLEDISDRMMDGPGGGVLSPGNGMQKIDPNDPLFWTPEQRREFMPIQKQIEDEFRRSGGDWNVGVDGYWRTAESHDAWRSFYNASPLRRGSRMGAWDGTRAPTAAEIAADAEHHARQKLINQGHAAADRKYERMIRELEGKLSDAARKLEMAAKKQDTAADKQMMANDPAACGPPETHIITPAGIMARSEYRATTRALA